MCHGFDGEFVLYSTGEGESASAKAASSTPGNAVVLDGVVFEMSDKIVDEFNSFPIAWWNEFY